MITHRTRTLAFASCALLFLAACSQAWAQSGNGAPAVAGDLQPGSHLVFGATAHTLPAGHGYFQITQLAVPRFDVGITDRLTIGAGTLAFYPRLVLLTPKLQVYRGATTTAAVGIIHLTGKSDVSGGVVYTVATKDVGNTSFTAGIGMGYARYDDKKGVHRGRQAVALVGAEFRRSAHNTILLEGYAFGPGGVVMAAGRHTWTRFSLDYGAVFVLAPEQISIPAPVINLTWGF